MEMNCAIYCRVSTERQKEKHTIDSQLRLLPELAKSRGYSITESYVDDGFSAESIEGRPSFKRLLEDAEDKKFNALAVIDFDRLTRSQKLIDLAIIKDIFRRNKIKVLTPTQEYDFSDEEDDFISDLMGILAKREKLKILRRMERGKIEKLKQNKFIGGKEPFGYKYNRDLEKYEIVEEEAETIRLIFKLCNENISTHKIQAHLNAHNIKTPSESKPYKNFKKHDSWAISSIKKILSNPLYYGNFINNKTKNHGKEKRNIEEWITVKVPPIISKEDYEYAQLKLKERKCLSKRNSKREYLLSGLLYCSHCNSKMVGEYWKERYYICYNRRRHHLDKKCPSSWHKAEELEKASWEKISELLKNPALLKEIIKNEDVIQDDIPRLNELIQEKDNEERRLLKLYRKGKLSEKLLDEQMQDLNKEREILRNTLSLSENKQKMEIQREAQLKDFSRFTEILKERIDNFSYEEKRECLKLILFGKETGIFIKDENIEIHGIIDFSKLNKYQENIGIEATTCSRYEKTHNNLLHFKI